MSTALLATGGVTTVLFLVAAWLALRHRDQPGAIPFAVLSVLLGVGCVIAMVGIADATSAVREASFAAFTFTTLTWIVVAIEYTGRGPTVTRGLLAGIAAFGTLAVVLVVGSVVPEELLSLVRTINFVLQASKLGFVVYGILVVARSAVRYDELPTGGTWLLSTTGVALLVLEFVQTTFSAVGTGPAFAAIVVVSLFMALLFVTIQMRYRVFERRPSAGHLARETVLDSMSAAVVIADRRNAVLDYNATAARLFGLDRQRALGRPVSSTVFSTAESDRDGSDEPVEINTFEGHRQFAVQETDLTAGDDQIGRAYVLRDVTDRRTHEQRLNVLNRVLRHNLRNELDAVHGFAETIEIDGQSDDIETERLADRIETTARDLAALGETVARTERLLARDATDRDSVDLGGLARSVATDLTPPGTVTVSGPEDGPEIRADAEILEAVLRELIENGIDHSDRDEPNVEITIRRENGEVTLSVADDGPGIPEQDRAVLLEGEETPLRHGRGLGLWLAHWGMVRLGGSLAFSENDPRGSVVTLRVPSRPLKDDHLSDSQDGTHNTDPPEE